MKPGFTIFKNAGICQKKRPRTIESTDRPPHIARETWKYAKKKPRTIESQTAHHTSREKHKEKNRSTSQYKNKKNEDQYVSRPRKIKSQTAISRDHLIGFHVSEDVVRVVWTHFRYHSTVTPFHELRDRWLHVAGEVLRSLLLFRLCYFFAVFRL
jgi:hypothetical protein